MRVVFVHGAFVRDGAWWWAPVAAKLRAAGIASTAIELPSCGEAGADPTGSGPGLAEDAAAVRAGLDGGEPVVLVAHSYGGVAATEAGPHPNLVHLVYVSSFLPRIGESLAALAISDDPVPVAPRPNGSVTVVAGAGFDERFFQDVTDPVLVAGAHERLSAQSAAVFGAPVTAVAWDTVPSTYLVCARDNSTDPALQRAQAERATHRAELPTGHHPFLSHPELVAAAVLSLGTGRA